MLGCKGGSGIANGGVTVVGGVGIGVEGVGMNSVFAGCDLD